MSEKLQERVEQLPLGPEVRVITWNEDGLLALDKPAGVRSHPNEEDENRPSLLEASYDFEEECYEWVDENTGEARQAWLINRLDSPTSGVILLALDHELGRLIQKQFAGHHVTKVYLAIVRHPPRVASGVWSDKLQKKIYNGKRPTNSHRVVAAKARYSLVKRPIGGFPVGLLKLVPVTGRTHQLRVQCKKHGHPVVGDRTYGHFAFNREVEDETGERGMMLHSSETIVHYAFHGKPKTFRAKSEMPKRFHSVLRFRPGMRTSRPESESGPLSGRRFRA
ncbi:MAG: RluA family pseudouridine synthase [Opitutales bacterium]